MKGAAFQERIEFHFLETARCARTLLVTRGDIARGGFPLCLGFRAFKDDDVSWHDYELLSRGTILHYSSSSSSKIVDSMTF